MKKRPWYIWLSVLSFLLLWCDTIIKILAAYQGPLQLINNTKGLDLWIRALGQFFRYLVGLLMIPAVLTGLLFGVIINHFPNTAPILQIAHLFIFYLLGVSVSGRHVLWRAKNLPDKGEA